MFGFNFPQTLLFIFDKYLSIAATLGLYSHDPAHSCKEIRDVAGGSRKDGKYWIDPEKNGNPLNVYCDMTTDGGKRFLCLNCKCKRNSSS